MSDDQYDLPDFQAAWIREMKLLQMARRRPRGHRNLNPAAGPQDAGSAGDFVDHGVRGQ
jgi:hypothetical protein